MSRWKACGCRGCLRRARQHGYCDAHWKRLRTKRGLRPELPIGGYIRKREIALKLFKIWS